jgi:hypothetical protein
MKDGIISQEDCTELLNKRMQHLYNKDKGKLEYDVLDTITDSEFDIVPIEDTITDTLRRTSSYY